MTEPIKVLIVDDSRLFRGALEQALAGQDDIKIVGSVFNGPKALDFIRQTPPDVVTLDVEMPGMNGLETLEQIQALAASQGVSPPGVVMVSAFTSRGADITIRALQAGAFDFVTKPNGPSAQANLLQLRDEVLAKVRAWTCRRGPPTAPTAAPGPIRRALQAPRAGEYRAVVIGASTGGPRALAKLLPELTAQVDLPILIVQHMPAGFTRSLAESLARQTGKPVVEAADGMSIAAGGVYISPGARHMVIRALHGPVIGLNDQPPENGCRPSADVLFRSAATAFGSGAIALILTGMGRDGTAGLAALKRAGGYVLAQDEASSVVWGMPGSAYEAGVTDELLPLNRLASAVTALLRRSRPE